MFREMRRSRQLLTMDATEAILERCTNGILACVGDDDYPYAVPLSYVYHNGKIYFHSAKEGHKIDAIASNPRVSFAVVDEDRIISEKFSNYYRSVIVFGKARIVQGNKYGEAFRALVEKYSADLPEDIRQKEIDTCNRACIVAIDIEHMTGKESIEYVKEREQ